MKQSDFGHNIKWTIGVIRRQSNLFESILADGMSKHYFQKTLGLTVGYLYRKVVDLQDYYYAPDYRRVRNYLKKQAESDSNFLQQLINKTYTAGDRLLDLAGEIEHIRKVNSISDDELHQQFCEYIELALSTVPMAYAAFPIEEILEEKIRHEIQSSLGNSEGREVLDEYFYKLVLSDVSGSDYALVEERDLIKIATELQKDKSINEQVLRAESVADLDPEVKQKVTKHALEFGWINTDGYIGLPWTDRDILVRIQRWLIHDSEKKLAEIEKNRKIEERNHDKALRELKASDDLLQLILLAKQYIELRSYRPMVLIKAGYQTRNLLTEIGRRFSLTYDELLHITHEEIKLILQGKYTIERKDLKRRRSRRAYIVVDGKTKWFFGDDVVLIEEKTEKINYSKVRELTGQIASRGVAVGHARLLIDVMNLDLSVVKEGDIVVASMTMPDMMPAMERASAYVTDEGGITCHAAIVSREMNVPCVIGTRLATKVIKDGDVVKVDANLGKVTIVSRK